jgi:hypothetical protein
VKFRGILCLLFQGQHHIDVGNPVEQESKGRFCQVNVKATDFPYFGKFTLSMCLEVRKVENFNKIVSG